MKTIQWRIVVLSTIIGLLTSLATALLWPRRFVSEAIVGYFFASQMVQLHPELLKEDFSPVLDHFQGVAFSDSNLLKIAKHNNLYPNDSESQRVKQLRRSLVMAKTHASERKWRDSICCWALSFGYPDPRVAQSVNSDLVAELLLSQFKTDLFATGCEGPGDCEGNSFQVLKPASFPNHKTRAFWSFGVAGIGTSLVVGITLSLLRSF